MVNRLTFLILLALVATVKLAEPEIEDNVLVLTDENFDETIAKYEYILVEFYAPWCGHCKKLAPEYSEAAGVLKDEIPLAKLDATAHSQAASKYKIQGYPTLKWFVKGVDSEYNGGRTKSDIVSWIRKKTGPVSKELTTVEAVESFKSANEVVIVHFGSEGLSAYLDIAKTIEDSIFGHCTTEECLTHFSVENGSIVLFKNFDEKRNDLPKGYTADGLKKFIEGNSTPTIMKFDEKSAQLIFGKATPGLFLYYDKNSENASALEAVLNEVAPKIKDKIQVISTGITEGLETRLAEYIGVTAADLPTVRIADTKSDLKKYNMEGQVTAENIIQFIDDWQNGKLKQTLKSEAIPETQTESVYVLVGKSFDEVVLDSSKDVLVEFYAPWCGHCKKIAPIYEELATKLKENTNLIIAKMDATANETDKVSIQGFPTIKFWPAGDKTKPIDFEGDRTVEGFVEFLKKHATHPIGKTDL
jgi:protein disulfide-isomerase A1